MQKGGEAVQRQYINDDRGHAGKIAGGGRGHVRLPPTLKRIDDELIWELLLGLGLIEL